MLAPQRRSSRTNIFFELFRGYAPISRPVAHGSKPLSSPTAPPETGIPVRILPCCHTLSGDPSGGLHVAADVVTPRGTTVWFTALENFPPASNAGYDDNADYSSEAFNALAGDNLATWAKLAGYSSNSCPSRRLCGICVKTSAIDSRISNRTPFSKCATEFPPAD